MDLQAEKGITQNYLPVKKSPTLRGAFLHII